jgi:small subunit ribosomal protein S6
MAETQTSAGTKAPAAHNQYEAMFLFPGSAGSDVEGAIKLARGIIERHDGKILVIKKWDERKLAYELARQKRGLFIIAYFKAPGTVVTAIERDVSLSDQVIRVLVTRAEHLNEQEMAAVEPQPIQPREERNPWDRPEPRSDRPRDDRPRDDRPPRDDRAPRDERTDRPPTDRPPRPKKDEIPAPAAKD